MATGQMSEFIQHLRRTVGQDGAGMTDGELLDCFVHRRDEAALASIVRRHGPMVWGVCRRILRSHHDAEDAFQATFLVLVRKATSIQPRSKVANWLYGVAHKTALYARATTARRRRREMRMEEMLEPAVQGQESSRDLSAVLDLELSRLPDHYRTAIVHCDLQGKTRKEVARQLGLPEGTLSGWLARGRAMLATRLARHGLAVSSGALAAVLSQNAVCAGVSKSVMVSTIKAACLFAAGKTGSSGAISAKAMILMEGVSRTMMLNKFKSFVAVLVVATTLAAGAALRLWPVLRGADPPPARTEGPPISQPAKTKIESKPVVIRDDASVDRLAYCHAGDTVVSLSISWHPVEIKGKKALAASSTVKLWDAKTGKLKRTPVAENDYITGRALSSDGKRAAIAGTKIEQELGKGPAPVEIRIMNQETWELQQTLEKELKLTPGEWVEALAFSPDGKMLAFGGISQFTENGSFMQIWNVAEKRLQGGTKKLEIKNAAEPAAQPVPGNVVKQGRVTCLAFSPDGKMVAAGDREGKVRLYDAKTVEEKQVFGEGDEPVFEIAFSPNGKLLATIREIDASPEGKILTNEGSDRSVHLWNVETGKLQRRLKRDRSVFSSLAFSPDGKFLATGGAVVEDAKLTSAEVVIWDAHTGDVTNVVPHGFPNFPVCVTSLAFAPDGKTLAIGGGRAGDLKEDGKTTGQISLVPLESARSK